MIPPRSAVAGLLVVAFAIAAAACGGQKNPEGWASPVDQGSTLFYFPDKDRVSAVEYEDGRAIQAWTFPAPGQDKPDEHDFHAVYDAAVADGLLYFGSWEGRMIALDTETGVARWALHDEISGGIVGGPVVAEGVVAFGTTDGRVYVRDAATGATAPNWPNDGLDLPKGVWAAPVIAGGKLFVATMGGELMAYDIASGEEDWEEPFKASGAIADLALASDTRLFVPSLDNKVYLVETATGEQIGAAFVADDWIWTRPAFADGVAYFGDFSGKVYALDITGNEPVPAPGWDTPYDSGTRIKAAPVVIGNTLVVATRDPEIHFLDITNQARLNMVPLEGAGTVRAGLLEYEGMAIVATTRGRLFVADPEAWRVVPLDVAGAQ